MGYALAFAACFSCGRFFGFNPTRVPSIRDREGIRQPLCRVCVDKANVVRRAFGQEPFIISVDAYEPIVEEELA